MKKYIFLLLIGAFALNASGNIAAPRAHISEIYFDSLGNWTIEIGFYEYELMGMDSLRVVSSSGSSLVAFLTTIPGGGFPGFDSLSLISNANLASPVAINENGDILQLIYYFWCGWATYDSVVFGNYPNSVLDCIQSGESIAYIGYYYNQSEKSNFSGERVGFSIDNSPTIGTPNDTTGAMGTYSGIVYDPDGNVFTQGWFYLIGGDGMSQDMYIHPDGSFSERVFARRYTSDTICLFIPPPPYYAQSYTTQPIDFCLRPDSSHNEDIITLDLIQGIEQPEEDFGNAVVVSPNPFTDKVTFYINLKGIQASDELFLEICGRDGRSLQKIKIPSGRNSFEWSPERDISPGVLVYRLVRNGQILKTGKMVKL